MAADKFLTDYARTGDEAAFRKVAERYSGIVFACAFQRTGSADAAEEIVQNVFVTLAKNAKRLQKHPALSGWLYTAARNESANYLRRESKRRQKMKAYQAHQENQSGGESLESEVVPHLVETLEDMSESDRNLILLRFFDGMNHREIASALRKSEVASRKQLERALSKLRDLLRKRGVSASGATLAAALTTQLAKHAPEAIIESATKGAAIAASTTPTLTLTTAMALTPPKLALLGTAVVWLAVGGATFFAGREQSRHARQNHELVAPKVVEQVDVSATQAGKEVLPEPTLERLRFLIRSTEAEHRLLEFRLAVKKLGVGQLRDLAEYAQGRLIYSEEEDRQMAIALLSSLIVHDSDAALAFAEGSGTWQRKLLPDVVAAWAVVDQEAALDWIANAGDLGERAFAATLDKIGERDRAAAIALFRETVEAGIVSPHSWDSDDFFREWVKDDPATAIREAMAVRDLTKRDGSVHRALAAWGRFAPEAAQNWLEEHSAEFNDAFSSELIVSLVDGWAEQSPAGAAEYLLGIKDHKTQERAAHFLLRDWSAQSFGEAENWVASVENPDRRELFEYILVVATREYGNREEAIAYAVDKYDVHKGMNHALFLQSREVLWEDPLVGIDWVRKELPEPIQPLLMNQAMNILQEMRPEEAVHHLDIVTDPISREKQFERSAKSWARVDLESSREWANALPDSAERDRALAGVASAWIESDPEEAAGWIRGLDASETRDFLAYRYAKENSSADPAGAIELASGIEHTFRREEALETAMRVWLQKNPEEARATIEQTDVISETIKWRLLR